MEVMEEALQNLAELARTEGPLWRSWFEVLASMPGSEVKFRDIAKGKDIQQALDTLAEVQYAVVFSELGFHVEVEPLRNQSHGPRPDLRIAKDGHSCLVEVRRFRPSPTPVIHLQEEAGVLTEYGNHQRDWETILGKIEGKFRQAGNDGIIAVWNNNDNLEYVDAQRAAHNHARRDIAGRSSLLLFKSHLDEPLYCYALRRVLPPYQRNWKYQLEQINPTQLLRQPYLRNRE